MMVLEAHLRKSCKDSVVEFEESQHDACRDGGAAARAVVIAVTVTGLNRWVVNRTLSQLGREISQQLETLQSSIDCIPRKVPIRAPLKVDGKR